MSLRTSNILRAPHATASSSSAISAAAPTTRTTAAAATATSSDSSEPAAVPGLSHVELIMDERVCGRVHGSWHWCCRCTFDWRPGGCARSPPCCVHLLQTCLACRHAPPTKPEGSYSTSFCAHFCVTLESYAQDFTIPTQESKAHPTASGRGGRGRGRAVPQGQTDGAGQ